MDKIYTAADLEKAVQIAREEGYDEGFDGGYYRGYDEAFIEAFSEGCEPTEDDE